MVSAFHPNKDIVLSFSVPSAIASLGNDITILGYGPGDYGGFVFYSPLSEMRLFVLTGGLWKGMVASSDTISCLTRQTVVQAYTNKDPIS